MKVSSNSVTLIGCVFTENKAVNSGGVLSLQSNIMQITNCKFNTNYATS